MKPLIATAAIALLAGCATAPLPDGSRIQRLPESAAAPAPVLSEQQTRELTEMNARILAEQNQARQREEALAARAAREPPPVYWGLNFGWSPGWRHGWDGWVWTGSRWAWRPRWGVDVWVPFGY